MKRVTFIGDPTQHEFRDPLAWMKEYCALSLCDTIESAMQQLESFGSSTDTVVFGQVRPGQFDRTSVERIRLRAPGAQMLRLLGGWCEGEQRIGRPLLGTATVPWHQFVAKATSELVPRSRVSSVTGLVVIRTTSRDSFEAISEVCNLLGHPTVWVTATQVPNITQSLAGIWDCRNSIEADRQALCDFTSRLRPAATIALLGFPRGSDRQMALECGAADIVAKPYVHADLHATLRGTTGSLREFIADAA